jgi:nitric oxide reductase subunit C
MARPLHSPDQDTIRRFSTVLSKSQARLFFFGGTAFFTTIFLILTVDTLRQLPERTNTKDLSESAIRGKHLFDSSNCMGCHTILGEGAYYAPELTKVVDRRGPEWIAIFLADPEAMFPGQRRMVQYNFTEGEIADLIAFMDWIGKIDTNGFPAEPDLGTPQLAGVVPVVVNKSIQSSIEPPAYYKTVCIACHAVGGSGGTVGPALDGVSGRFSREELHTWLADPGAVKPGTAMPNLKLPDALRNELVDWLVTLE